MPLPKKLQDKWDEAKRTGKPVSLENLVVCDICLEDYTDKQDSGGFVFSGYGYCPKCVEKNLERIKSYNEEMYIQAYCPEGMSFADFIRAFRGDDAMIVVHGI